MSENELSPPKSAESQSQTQGYVRSNLIYTADTADSKR